MGMKKADNKKYQVFVSSTREDLIDERRDIAQSILKCDCFPAGMELWPASSDSQWEVIKKVIDESDYYLLIIAGKYGSETKNSEGKSISYTELEFDYAVSKNKPIIALLHEHPENLPSKFSENSSRKRKRLNDFREKVCKDRLVAFWNTRDELKNEAMQSIYNAIKNSPSGGWIKDTVDITDDIVIEPTSTDSFSGKWESYFMDIDGTEKSDSYDLKYDTFTNRLYGIVKRVIPNKDKEYSWKCDGYVVGDNIVMVYWSLNGKTRLTCGSVYLRYAKHLEYIGVYITYDYKQNKIIKVPIRVKKL